MNNDQLQVLLNLLTPTAENMNKIIKDVNQFLDGKIKADIKITLSNNISSGLDKLVKQIESINSVTSSIVAIREETNAQIAKLDAETVAVEQKTAAELKVINSERVQNEELTAARIEKIRLESELVHEQIINESAKTQKNNAVTQYAEQEGMLSGHLNNFKNLVGHHLAWLGTGALMYGGYEVFKEGIVEIDKGMAGLRQTLETTYTDMGKELGQKELNDIANQFMDVAKDYGEGMNDLLDGAKLVSRQYKDMGEIMAFVRAGTALQIVDNMSLVDSFKALEAITNQYGMVAKNAGEAELYTMAITDKLSNVSHNAAISANDLADGLMRSGSILHEMGTDLDHSIGLITAGVRSSQLSGSQIGQALKSVAGSIKSGEAVKELEKLGISIKDAEGNFRSLTAILEDVMIKSAGTEKSLDEVYKAISGGKFQFAKVAATIGDYSTYVETVALSIASAGKAHEYMGAQMDTVVKHAQLLKEQLVGLMNSAGQGGLTTVIKGLIDGLTEFVKWVNNLNAYNVVMVGGLGALITIGLKWGSVVSYIKELTAAWAETQAVLEGVTGNWIPLIVGGIGALMAYGYATQQEMDAVNQQVEAKRNLIAIQEKEQKQIMDRFDVSKQQLDNDQKQAQFIADMAEKHAQLTKALSETAKGTKAYQELSDDLIATEKATTIALDTEGKKRLELAGFTQQAYDAEKTALNDKIDQDKKLYDESLAKAKEYTQNQLKLSLARIDALKQETEAEQIAANVKAKRLNTKAEKLTKQANDLALSAYYDKTDTRTWKENEAQKLFTEASDLFSQASGLAGEAHAKEINDQWQKVKLLQNDITSINGQLVSEFVGVTEDKVPLPDSTTVGSSNESKSSVTSILDTTSAIIAQTNALANQTKTQSDSIQKTLDLTSKNKDYTTQLSLTNSLISSQKTQIDQLSQANTTLKSKMDELGNTDWLNSSGELSLSYYEQYNSATKDVQDSMEKQASSLQKLSKAMVDNNKSIQSLRDSQLSLRQSMIELNTEIADNAISVYKKALEMERDVATKTIDAQISEEEQRHNQRMDNIDAEIQALEYQANAEDYAKSLTKAQQDVMDIQHRIDILSLDNSLEAKQKRQDLSEQLADKQSSLADMQNKHELDLRKQNLQNLKNTEDAEYNTTKDSLEKQKQARDYYWNEQINNEQYFASLRTQIINGNVDVIKSKMSSFLSDFKNMNQQTITELGLSWNGLQGMIGSINITNTSLGNVTNINKAKPTITASGADAAILRAQYGDSINIISGQGLAGQAGTDRTDTNKMYQSVLSDLGVAPKNNVSTDQMWQYADGGETSKTGFHWLDGLSGKPERVLSPEQTMSFNKLVENIMPITNVMDRLVNNFKLSSPVHKFTGIAGTANITNNITFTGSGALTRKDLDQITEYIHSRTITGLKRMGLNL